MEAQHHLSAAERREVLRFVSSILWADARLTATGIRFFVRLAASFGYRARDAAHVLELLSSPPAPEDVDPLRVAPATARVIRDVARAAAGACRARGASLAAHEHARLLCELLTERRATSDVARCA